MVGLILMGFGRYSVMICNEDVGCFYPGTTLDDHTLIVNDLGVRGTEIRVIHNGIEVPVDKHDNIVGTKLFLRRITHL